MMRASIKGGLPLAALLLLAACQSYEPAMLRARSAMDGDWRSTDGVFYANFQDGRFTSRFTETNEILAQGTYTVAGNSVSMQWLSVQAQQQRSANCLIVGAGVVTCNQAGGGSFGLQRTA
jgi:hypothetical protein